MPTYLVYEEGVGWVTTTSAGIGSSPLTTKGDLYGYSTADARIPVGADGDVLTADSTQALGVKWAAGAASGVSSLDSITGAVSLVAGSNVTITDNSPSAGDITIAASGSGATFSGASVYASTATNVSSAVSTTISMDTSLFDTDSYWSNANPTRFTIPTTGYYLLYANGFWGANSGGRRISSFGVNGVAGGYGILSFAPVASPNVTYPLSFAVVNSSAGDYWELRTYQDSGSTLTWNMSALLPWTIVKLG